MRMRSRGAATWRPALLGALLFLAPQQARAHAFGARYDLPIPLWMWVAGAGAAVVLSFAVMGFFLRDRQDDGGARRVDLARLPLLRAALHPWFLTAIRAASLFLFFLIIVAGLWGNEATTKNIAPVLVWVIWWVGFAYATALFGDLWRLINPWSILFGWAERRFGLADRALKSYPAWLGCWPAVLVFLIFAWLEIVSEIGELPVALAGLILAYSLWTWTGMWRYGQAAWLAKGEAFAVCFGLLARFSITEGGRGREDGRPFWRLRPPGVGLLVERPVSPSMVVFTVLLLATVSFDGIAETPFWQGVLQWFAENQLLRPLLIALQEAGVDLVAAIKSLGLVATPVLFLLVFLVFSWMTRLAGGGGVGLWDCAGRFVLSLVPIAIAYHLSHYFSYLMLAGQLVVPLASDPFGFGWDLFGTAGRTIDISVVSARMVWYLVTVAVILGHVFAVYLGHAMALRTFASRRAALMSQVPLLLLMVGYTMLSLWILAQPVVNTG